MTDDKELRLHGSLVLEAVRTLIIEMNQKMANGPFASQYFHGGTYEEPAETPFTTGEVIWAEFENLRTQLKNSGIHEDDLHTFSIVHETLPEFFKAIASFENAVLNIEE